MPNGTMRTTPQAMPQECRTWSVPSLLSDWRLLTLLFIILTLGFLFHLSLTLLIVMLFALIGAFLVGQAFSIANTLIHPRRSAFLTPFPASLPVEQVQFPSSKGNRQVHGLFIQRPGAGTAIIVAASHDVLCQQLWETGHHVLVFEPIGVSDFLGAIAYTRKRLPSAWLGAFGSSMGGTVCILGSARNLSIEAIVTDSAFATHNSAMLVALQHTLHHWPRSIIHLLCWVTSQILCQVEPVQEIKKLARPILLIHGLTATNACPRDAQLLYQAASKPKALWLLKSAEHRMSSPAYIAQVTSFFERHLKQRPTEEAHRQVLPDPMASLGENTSGTQRQTAQPKGAVHRKKAKQGRDEQSLKGEPCPFQRFAKRLHLWPAFAVFRLLSGSRLMLTASLLSRLTRPLGTSKSTREECSSIHPMNKEEQACLAPAATPLRPQEQITQAQAFLQLLHQEQQSGEDDRLSDIHTQIEKTGTYQHTTLELEWGARIAWRNSTRCTGRLHWKSLDVRDMRHLTRAEDIFAACLEHIKLATNGGKIRSLMTVFAPGIRIWNSQLIRYAGYVLKNGRVIGDPAHVELTNALFQLGWKGGKGTPFDILPLAIQMPDRKAKLFELPPEIVMEVPIEHPTYPWFADLGLKWHALPAISNMLLEIGGISYTAAPFNGWYLGTEIGARNLADQQRYNMLPVIAEKLGLDRRQNRTLWKDRALVELNVAVLSSFAKHGVTMVDHHTVAQQLVVHEEKEKQAGRCMYADWGWVVPPLSGSTIPVFHREYENKVLSPNFFSQPDPWQDHADSVCK